MRDAIQKAIEGGWNADWIDVVGMRWYANWQKNTPYFALKGKDIDSPTMSVNDAFNDPLFWQLKQLKNIMSKIKWESK